MLCGYQDIMVILAANQENCNFLFRRFVVLGKLRPINFAAAVFTLAELCSWFCPNIIRSTHKTTNGDGAQVLVGAVI
jgi:hypothetical protein